MGKILKRGLLSCGLCLCSWLLQAQGALPAAQGVSLMAQGVSLTAQAQPLSAELLGQFRLAVPPGEYSGICYLEDDLYAVVDDDDPGAGLHIFSLPLGRSGRPRAVWQFKVDAGQDASSAPDNEDIVYVSATKTFWVCSEAQTSIKEYDRAGRPTGRSVLVPETMKNAPANGGLEALATDGTSLWTLSEMPLKGDAHLRHQLLRFSLETRSLSGLTVYECDPPLKGPEDTRAYVHGISALTALPDGRLLVLEREVYVPAGSAMEALEGSFGRALIYVTDPLRDTRLPLQKTLLAQINTSAANLANLEGMCLGRPLPDGRPTLLLIADSERGKGGLTKEYLFVLALEGL